MVVTASHNPGRDNGVKLVEPDGGTLPMALERAAEMLANAGDDDAVAQIEALIADASSIDELDRLEAALKSRDYDSVLAPPPPLEEAGTVV